MSPVQKRLAVALAVVVAVGLAAGFAAGAAQQSNEGKDWSFNATIIEACSCPMFCQCYFNDHPSQHHTEAPAHFCKFNNAFKVNRGRHGGVRLDGVKFWVAGDLGADFSDGQMDWAILTFDPSVTKPQRDAITEILGHVYPVRWGSFTVARDAEMEWTAGKDQSVAKLDGGKTAEVVLHRFQGMTDDPIVIRNLKYFGIPRNDGFVMMPNDVEAYRVGDKAFEYRGTNGFMITIDITSKDVAPASGP
jgi:hypothetical protein